MRPNAERLAGVRECLRKTRGLLVVAAQHLALPVDEVHASASLAGDPLVIVLGRIFVVVQPVLNLHASVMTQKRPHSASFPMPRWVAAT